MLKPALLIVGNNDQSMQQKVEELSAAYDGDKVIYDKDIETFLRANYSNIEDQFMPQYIAQNIDAEIEGVNLPGSQYSMLFIFIQNDEVVRHLKKKATVVKIFDPNGYEVKKYKKMKADITIGPADNIVTSVAKCLR